MKELSIAHLDTQMSWRGGERQVLELVKELNTRRHKNVLFCKPSSELSQRANEAGINVIHLPFRGEWDIVSAFKLRSYIIRERVNIQEEDNNALISMGQLALSSDMLSKTREFRR